MSITTSTIQSENARTRTFRSIRYAFPILICVVTIFSYMHTGILAFTTPIFAYVLVPFLDALLPAHKYNLTKEEEILVNNDPVYDALLYAIPFLQLFTILFFAYTISTEYATASWVDIVGWIFSSATSTTAYAAVSGHELGHREKWYERALGSVADLTMLCLHRPIEHNLGHHKKVATPEDPVSANYNELIYTFWFRAMYGIYKGAWKLETNRLKKEGKAILSFHNRMIVYLVIQFAFLLGIYLIFGIYALIAVILSAFLSNILHETVCYIEHYGLQRNKLDNGKYERIQPHHSWNSENIISRILLYELPRHSDHHYRAHKKYPTLLHHPEVPTMPSGYAVMIVMAMFPPIWFMVMNPMVKKVRAAYGPPLP